MGHYEVKSKREKVKNMENKGGDIKKRVYVFALNVINFVDTLKKDAVTIVIINQLIRSSTSIGANIIEAQAGSSKKDFINFYHHALKSANETKFWIGIMRDSKRCDKKKASTLLDEVNQIAKILGAILVKMKFKKS